MLCSVKVVIQSFYIVLFFLMYDQYILFYKIFLNFKKIAANVCVQ